MSETETVRLKEEEEGFKSGSLSVLPSVRSHARTQYLGQLERASDLYVAVYSAAAAAVAIIKLFFFFFFFPLLSHSNNIDVDVGRASGRGRTPVGRRAGYSAETDGTDGRGGGRGRPTASCGMHREKMPTFQNQTDGCCH